MAGAIPIRLLAQVDGVFSVIDPQTHPVPHFDIISYRWGTTIEPYTCGIPGVEWPIVLAPAKLEEIKRLMVAADIAYLWADSVCINQSAPAEKAGEIAKMYEYYKSARRCHVLLDMDDVWDPQGIVDDLRFLGHVLSYIGGAALATEARLGDNLTRRLAAWADDEPWAFELDRGVVRSAGIEMGVVNCYATCIHRVRSLFRNLYFSRVWTFQEMLLGKNITMWGINDTHISYIGEFEVWMDLAIDAQDKAVKLLDWIEESRVLTTGAVGLILRVIEEDRIRLTTLQIQVMGISGARTDIISGGPHWWLENHRGVGNVFSAISIRERECFDPADVFRGLLGVFHGLFSADEIARDMSGKDLDKIQFNFFRQLSIKTGFAWTKLAISSGQRGEWDWIPVLPSSSKMLTTDCFAGVVKLGRLATKQPHLAKSQAFTGLAGKPRQYMTIKLTRQAADPVFHFTFRGCNCGKSVSTGLFKREKIPDLSQAASARDVRKDETGRALVQCATLLGSVMDPGGDHVAFRKRLLRKLQPEWAISDPNAKPTRWEDRCVSGTFWEHAHPHFLRSHNLSMNLRMADVTGCVLRLENESTAGLSCEVRVRCGCVVVAPFSLVFEAITAVEGSFLGDAAAEMDRDNRIILQDGLGLVQVGDVGKTFHLVAFEGDVDSYKAYASVCRKTKEGKPAVPLKPWPRGRALVPADFSHDMSDVMRDYGYLRIEGSGNLLILRNGPIGNYKLVGVCIDDYITSKKDKISNVTIR
ncbi:hypothetical protein PG987_006002 [Apiospora arundinis]